jgi:hypothetical protein
VVNTPVDNPENLKLVAELTAQAEHNLNKFKQLTGMLPAPSPLQQ